MPLLALLFCLLAARSADAQTLSEGAVAFTGMEANNDYDFAFVAIQDIPAGEVIYFASDGGWSGGSVGASGKRIQWTAPAGGLEPGDRVEFLNPKNNSDLGVSSGSASVPGGSNGNWVIKKEGMYAYQGGSIGTSSPTILAFLATDRGSSHAFPSIEGQSLDLNDSEGDNAGWDDGLITFASPAAMLVALSEYNSTTSQYWDDNNNFNTSSFTVSGIDVLHETFQNDLGFTKSNQTSFYGGSDDDYYGIWDEYGDDDDFDGESTPPGGDIHGFGNFQGNCLIGEDMDADGTVPAYLDWVVDISGVEAGLFFQLSAAEQGMDNSPSNDYIRLYATLNPTNYGSPVIDLDGSTLSGWNDKLKAQAGSGTYDGTTLYLRLETGCNQGNDRWAVDNVIVSGTEIQCADADSDGLCDDSDGCTDTSACNYAVPSAQSCVYLDGVCETCVNGEVVDNDADNDGVCDADEVTGCTDSNACNYDDDPTTDTNNGLCVYATAGCTSCSGETDGTGTVVVTDSTDPTITPQGGITAFADGACEATGLALGTPATSDNCGVASVTNDAPSTYPLGVTTVTWTVTDTNGNTATATQTVTVLDNVPPLIAAPADVSVSADAGACSALASGVSLGSPTASDNCSVTFSNDAPSVFPLGQTIVTWTAEDGSGNTATDTQTVTVTDDESPVVTAVSPTSVQLSTGAATVDVANLTFTVSDNCSGSLTYAVSSTSGGTFGSSVDLDCDDIGTVTLFFIATDAAGNASAEFSQDFTITDATGLTAVAQDITVYLDADGSYTLDAAEVDNGSVGNCNTSLSVNPAMFDCGDIGTNEVALTITDSISGASNSTTAIVTVVDNTPPNVMPLPSVTVNLGATGTASISPSNVAAFANPADYCTPNADLTFEIKRENGSYGASVTVDCSDLGVATFNVLVTAIDAAGNVYESGAIPVTVLDAIDPTIDELTTGQGQTLGASGSAIIDATTYITSASDNCTASGSLTYEMSETSGSGFAATFAADCDDVGDKTFYFRVVDASGNASSETTEVITISDNATPTATANDRTLSLNGASTVTLQADDANFNTSTDNCSLTSEIKLSSAGDETYASSYEFPGAGSYGVTLRVTDPGGNTATDNATITVIAEPDDIIIYFEDFETEINGASPNTELNEGAGEESANGRWTFDDLGIGTPYIYAVGAAGNAAFNIFNGDQVFWYSSEVDISAYSYVEISSILYEAGTGVTSGEGLKMSAIVDGVESVVASDTDGDLSGTMTSSTVTGDVLIVKFEAVGSGDMFFDDVTVTGYCVDLDANGICDSEQNCVETAGVDCGCMDKTACTYEADATHASADSCFYPGMLFQGAACGTAGQFVYYDSDCSCTSQDWISAYSENFDDESDQDGYYFGTFTDVSGVNSPSSDGWEINLETSPNNPYQVGVDGFFSGISEVDGNVFVFEGLQSEATWTSPDYSLTNEVYSKVSVDVGYTFWSDYDASGGFDIDDEMRGFVVLDDVLQAEFVKIKGGGNAGLLGSINGTNNVTVSSAPTDKSLSRVQTTVFVGGESTIALQMKANHERELNSGGSAVADEFTYFDLVTIQTAGEAGCMSPGASNYSASATYDDGSCESFTTAYSRYDGGFSDKIWAGTACGGDCGTAPFLDARSVAALEQTSQTNFNYVVSSGTTVTVDGTQASQDAGIEDLFVRNLTIESGGELVIPSGKRLRVVGDFLDLDGNGISGGGEFCIDDSGRFLFCTAELNGGNACPTEVTIPNLAIASGGALDIPEEAKVNVTGDLTFEDAAPQLMEGLLVMGGSSAQTIRGNGATVDRLQISNTTGVVSVDGRLAVQGRLTLDSESNFDMGGDTLVFVSVAITEGGIEKTGLLDAVPTNASLTGSNGGPAKVQVQRFIGRDDSFTPQNGYFQFASPIENVTVGDFAQTDGFYSAGWPGSAYPNWIQTILFWDESEGEFVAPTSNSTPLDTLGGAWLYLLSNQEPTLITNGALKGHSVDDTFDFDLTRSETTSGWNLVYNPFQGRLDWDQVVSANDSYNNETLVEDAVLVYDSQQQVFLRYTSDEANANTRTKNAYIEPGQSFYVRLKDDFEQSGAQTFTLSPSMLDNAATGADFIRSSESEAERVVFRTTNAYGISHAVIHVDDAAEEDKNLTYLYSSNAKVGQMTIAQDGEEFVAHSLTLDEESKPVTVFSKAGVLTQLRVDEVVGQLEACMYIEDLQTGDILPIEEGAALNFNPEEDITTDRFVLKMAPQALTTAVSADCPGPEEMGSIQVDLMGWSSDVTLYDGDMQVLQSVVAVEGEVSFAVPPGLYSMLIQTEEGVCKEVRRIAEVWPAEQPELLGLEALPAECNVGEAALAFELYGGGEFQTSLWQGGAPVWQEFLDPGEYEIGGFAPGEYVLKVDHTCLEAVELVSLSDPGMPSVSALYDAFVEVESSGGAWLEAQCVGCLEGNGFGYYWILDGDIVAEDEPLSTRVYSVGSYDLQLVAFGPDCEMTVPFEVLVGKHKIGSPDAVRWLGMVEDHLMAVFDEEWSGVQCRWYDSSGRLLDAQEGVTLVGEAFLPAPDVTGWLTLEVRSADGRMARWSGVR